MDEIESINRWIGHINGRLDIIESIINEEVTQKMIEDLKEVKRMVAGDPTLNVPPIYDTITRLNDLVSQLRAYQKKDQEYHHDMKIIVVGMATMHAITLILAIIGILT